MKAVSLICFSIILSAWLVTGEQQQSSCPLSGADEKFLIQRRKQGLRASLLAQLGLGNTNFSTPNRTVSKEQLDTFFALSQASDSLEEENQKKCQADEIYAQPITTLVGKIEEKNTRSQRNRRNLRKLDDGGNILSQFDLEFDFKLKDSLTSITRADLLLYQIAPKQKDNIIDGIQYIEIKAVFEPIGLKTVIASKNVNVYNEGYEAFDMMSATKLWVQRQINGTIKLEVTITCLSSKWCAEADKNGNMPTSVKFDFQVAAKKPRLVIVSLNPLEVTNRNRFRRQSQATRGSFCVESQSTCCLKNLTINFAEDLGMDFVILPKTFEANYCDGFCPISPGGDLMTPDLYFFITKLSGNPAASIEPCCAGTKFKPLRVILEDPENPFGTIIEEFKQVIVESCRCA